MARSDRRAAATTLLCLLLAALAGGAAAAAEGDASAPSSPPAFVPDDVPGAEEARAWLQHYSEGRQQRVPNWPAQVELPACGEASAGGRRHLLLAVVGSRWDLNASGWLDDPAAAAFDLVLISYADTAPDCPQCLYTFQRKGPK